MSLERTSTFRTSYLGVFVVDLNPDVDGPLVDANRAELLIKRISYAEQPEVLKGPPHDSGVLVDGHRSTGARPREDFLIDSELSALEFAGDHRSAFEALGVRLGRLRVSHLGVGMLEVVSEAKYQAALERELVSPSCELLRDLCAALEIGENSTGSSEIGLLPRNRILWWHRLQITSSHNSGLIIPEGSQSVQLGPGTQMLVGDGYSSIQMSDEMTALPELKAYEVTEGLFFATEDYLILDRSGRELAHYLERTSDVASVSSRSLAKIEEEGWALSRRGHAARLYMDERNRFLACDRRLVWELAVRVWGLVSELDSFQVKIDAVRDLSSNVVDALQSRQDSSRNLVLFILAIITALQGLLIAYDFSVNDDVSHDQPIRIVAVLVVFLASLGVAGYFSVRAYRERRDS